MAMTESENKKVDTTHAENTPRYYIVPEYSYEIKDAKYSVEIALPGVKKDQIKMKAAKDFFRLEAKREKVGYALDLEFIYETKPDQIKAHYEEGLLTVEIPIVHEDDHTTEVKIE